MSRYVCARRRFGTSAFPCRLIRKALGRGTNEVFTLHLRKSALDRRKYNGRLVMADRKEVEEKVVEIIAEQLGRDKETITCDSDIANDLGADSLDVAELMIAFEESFNIDIDEDKAQNIATVKDVVDQIAEQLDAA